MDKKIRTKACELAKEILTLKAVEKQAKESKEKLQDELTDLCDAHFDSFNEDGQLKLDEAGALIKTALNPPKMIFTRTEKALTPADRSDIALNIDKQYVILDLNFKKIQDRLESDKQLKKSLSTAGVAITQDIRYDVKPIK